MSPRPLTDEQIVEAVTARAKHGGNICAAARALNISEHAMRNRLAHAAERGLCGTAPVLPGYALKSVSTQFGPKGELQKEWLRQTKEPGPELEIPDGHTVSGISALTDGSGRLLAQWTKTKAERSPADIVETIKAAFDDYRSPRAAAPAPRATDADLLTLLPLADWHIGLFAWGAETGSNWDLKIAEDTIGGAIEDLIGRTPQSGHAIVLGGGDLLHSDNNENKTARSGNALDVDGRWPKVLMTACRLIVRTIDAALLRHQRVTARVLPGNHDEHSSTAVAYFLLAWYRGDPRVTIDVDPSLFFWHRHGKVMLGATHGHTVKIADMPMIMAHRRAEDWGATRHRFVHGFHLHHSAKFATEGNGVISEIHQTPTPQDAWHYGSGFLSGRSMQAITYHPELGEISRSRVAILDADLKAAA